MRLDGQVIDKALQYRNANNLKAIQPTNGDPSS